jgi:hypothetical protein
MQSSSRSTSYAPNDLSSGRKKGTHHVFTQRDMDTCSRRAELETTNLNKKRSKVISNHKIRKPQSMLSGDESYTNEYSNSPSYSSSSIFSSDGMSTNTPANKRANKNSRESVYSRDNKRYHKTYNSHSTNFRSPVDYQSSNSQRAFKSRYRDDIARVRRNRSVIDKESNNTLSSIESVRSPRNSDRRISKNYAESIQSYQSAKTKETTPMTPSSNLKKRTNPYSEHEKEQLRSFFRRRIEKVKHMQEELHMLGNVPSIFIAYS